MAQRVRYGDLYFWRQHDKETKDREIDIPLEELSNSGSPSFCSDPVYSALVHHHHGNSQWSTFLTEANWDHTFARAYCNQTETTWPLALKLYLDAYNIDPTRADPFHRIARYYRIAGKQKLAFQFATEGLKIVQAHPNSSANPNLELGLLEELSICAYYVGKLDVGVMTSNRLLLDVNTSHSVRTMARNNYAFYLPKLEGVTVVPIVAEFPKFDSGEGRYNPMNPCVITDGDGILVNCRVVNYGHKGSHYFPRDGGQIIRTRNLLLRYDDQLQLQSQSELLDSTETKSVVQGLEDMRIFRWRNELWCIANQRWTAEHPQLILGRIVDGRVIDKVLLIGPNGDQCEKNWLPYIRNDELYLIYSHQPLIILRYDRATKQCVVEKKEDLSIHLNDCRGSAPPIPFSFGKTDGYLGLVHEVIFRDERIYTHRFIWYEMENNLMIPRAVTAPFYFHQQGIEYSCGMTRGKNGMIVIGLGVDDGEAYLATINETVIRSKLSFLSEICPINK